jgi:hypothetical protein
MRSLVAAVTAAAMLAGCGQGGGGSTAEGTSPAEEKVATEIVEKHGVLTLDDATLDEVVGGQAQFLSFEHPDLTPEQAQGLTTAIRANIEAALPGLKKEMAGYLAETYSAKELDTYHAFIAGEAGQSIKDRAPDVMQKSIAAADAMTTAAVEKALAEVKPAAAAPSDSDAPPVDGAAPAAAPTGPAKPTDQQ